MDHKSYEKAKRQQEYITGMRPVFSIHGLFTDTTSNFIDPPEPEKFSFVKIRFRTRKANVDYIFLLTDDWKIPLDFECSEDYFDYYTTTIYLTDQPISYYFEVHSGVVSCIYDQRGAVRHHDSHYNFRIIPGFHTPDWAKGAVMYQIFTDRFCNGDTSNDVVSGEYYYINEPVQHEDDWYAPPSPHMDVRRFYGGDLQGIIDKLDYIKDLGIEVIYLNPIFVSPSNHKYDIQDYDYVDPHFGKIVDDCPEVSDPAASFSDEGNSHRVNNSHSDRFIRRVTSMKNLEAGNRLFSELVQKAHDRGIRIILDGVFNHCGSFNKWLDREYIYDSAEGYEKGAFISENSPYKEFFKFHHPSRWPNNTAYDGWWGHDTLPKLNYEESEKLWDYMMGIASKWVSPPYNADGWRLDVAADLGHSPECNHRFWKDFRKSVKNTKSDALILAEHYGDPSSWLMGDEWDSVMNYDAFMEPVSWFFTGMEKHSDSYREDLLGYTEGFWGAMFNHGADMTTPSLLVAMNELSNHDHSRFLTRTNRMVGRADRLGSKAAEEFVDPSVMRQAVILQMTWPGAPTVYYGDEAGLCGFTDPDNRRTYPWGRENRQMLNFHKDIIRVHKEHKQLKTGSLKKLASANNTLAYSRFDREGQIIVLFSNYDHPVDMVVYTWEVGINRDDILTRIFLSDSKGYTTEPDYYSVKGKRINITLPAKCGMILKGGK